MIQNGMFHKQFPSVIMFGIFSAPCDATIHIADEETRQRLHLKRENNKIDKLCLFVDDEVVKGIM